MNNSITNNCSIDFCEALTIVFVVLKLTGNINWSWWLVLGPIWIPIAIVIVLVFIIELFKT